MHGSAGLSGFRIPRQYCPTGSGHESFSPMFVGSFRNRSFLKGPGGSWFHLSINQIARTAKREGFHHRFIEKIVWEAELDLACFVKRTNLLCP
jgi:hypothetical protein